MSANRSREIWMILRGFPSLMTLREAIQNGGASDRVIMSEFRASRRMSRFCGASTL